MTTPTMTNRTAHALEIESMAMRAGSAVAIRRAAHDVAVVLTEAILGSDTSPDGCPGSVRQLAEIVARLNMAAALSEDM